MTKPDQRTVATMDMALEHACRKLPNGGDHATRKYVANKLVQAAKKGNTRLGALEDVARRALHDLSKSQVHNSVDGHWSSSLSKLDLEIRCCSVRAMRSLRRV